MREEEEAERGLAVGAEAALSGVMESGDRPRLKEEGVIGDAAAPPGLW